MLSVDREIVLLLLNPSRYEATENDDLSNKKKNASREIKHVQHKHIITRVVARYVCTVQTIPS